MIRNTNPQYAHFGQRLAASFIDYFIFSLLLSPLFVMMFGIKEFTQAELDYILKTQGIWGIIEPQEMLIQLLISLSIITFFWLRYAGTPGKRLLGLKVVDAVTGKHLSVFQSIIRYAGYMIAAFPMGLGFLWIFMDEKHQGWHDKLANSVVIKENAGFVTSAKKTDAPYDSDTDNDTFAA